MESHILTISSLFTDESFGTGSITDLRDIDGTSCYCSPESADELRRRIAHIPVNAMHWIDSGDYHYMTHLFLERLDSPFRLVLLDNHPDDQRPAFDSPGMLSCGGWVADARKLPSWRKSGDFPIYLSIDLDWLSEDVFKTDWDQGTASYDDLLTVLRSYAGLQIAGIDICGGITRSKGATDTMLEANRNCRERLASDIQDIFA